MSKNETINYELLVDRSLRNDSKFKKAIACYVKIGKFRESSVKPGYFIPTSTDKDIVELYGQLAIKYGQQNVRAECCRQCREIAEKATTEKQVEKPLNTDAEKSRDI